MRARFRVAFLVVVALAVLTEIAIDPIGVHPDGISYLDMGDAILGLQPWAIAGYFSPLYAAWVALAVRIAHPSIAHEFLVVRAASGVIVLLDAVAFEALLTEVIAHVRRAASRIELREARWRVFGYCLFLWSAMRNIGTAETTPDMAVMGVIFAATALVLRMSAPESSAQRPRTAAALGLVLGFGYLAKAVLFVNGFMILGVFTWLARKAPRTVLTAWAVFLFVAAPWIITLSLNKGRPTFGDVGRLTLIWSTSAVPLLNWQGDEPGYGTPVHATRHLSREPEVYEFATPFPVSYPPWYDASYWMEGVRVRILPAAILQNIIESFRGTFRHLWMLGVTLLVLASWARSLGPLAALTGPLAALAVPATLAYALYSVINIYPRYVAGWSALLYLFVVASWASWKRGRMVGVVEAAMLCLVLGFAVQLARFIIPQARASVDVSSWTFRHDDDGDVRVAQTLRLAGLNPGDRAAGIGSTGAYMYWHRLARLRMVAEAPGGGTTMYWRSDAASRGRVLDLFRKQGARVVVSDSLPDGILDPGWRRVAGSRYAYCLLSGGAPDMQCPALAP